MATQISFPVLQSINNGVNTAFNDQLFAAEPVWKKAGFVFEATSTGAAEVYPRLDMLKGLREWIKAPAKPLDSVVVQLGQAATP